MLEIGDESDEFVQRAAQSVEARHDERVAEPHEGETGDPLGPVGGPADHRVGEHDHAADVVEHAQLVDERLTGGGLTGVLPRLSASPTAIPMKLNP